MEQEKKMTEIEELKLKIDNFLKLKPILKRLLDIDGCVICGGAIRDIHLGKTPKDYDFFFTSKNAIKEALFSVNAFKSEGNEYVKTYQTDDGEIQLITKEPFANERDIVMAFDFTPIQFAYDGDKLTVGLHTFEDINKRTVNINVVTKPLQSLERLARYATVQENGIHDWNIDDAYQYILAIMITKPSRIILNSKKYDL